MKQLLQQLVLSSPSLLKVYCRDGFLPFDEMKTRVFVRARQLQPHLPDYRFKNYEALAFGKRSTEETVLDCLVQLAGTFLEFRDAEIRCKADHFEAWQQGLTRVPPLPLLVAAVHAYEGEATAKERLFSANFMQYSHLPSIYHPILEHFIQEEGLNEIHLHLNGTTEFDLFWQDALAFPRRIYRELSAAFTSKRREVYELYAQIDPDITPSDVRFFLDAACWIRDQLVRHLFLKQSYPEALLTRDLFSCFSGGQLLQRGRRHPLAVANAQSAGWNATTCEAMMLLAVYKRIEAGDGTTARLFHQYLLIQGYFNRLLVQQLEQVGFDQFQKITLNEIREFSEKQYLSRFRQLKGRYGNDLAYLEGRFAPKHLGGKTLALIQRIYRDYQRFLSEEQCRLSGLPGQVWFVQNRDAVQTAQAVGAFFEATHDRRLPRAGGHGSAGSAVPPFELKLTAHLIKKLAPEAKRKVDGSLNLDYYGGCRHAALRRELDLVTRRLAKVVRQSVEGRALVAGLDAAANEMHAPPEVFAASFRLFRRRGFLDFTYHAGEDFVHLVSGIRVIWEAVVFLDLRAGNRIGHGTAIGIDPRLWKARCGEAVLPMTRMEWLDNLIFAASMLRKSPEYATDLPRIYAEICKQYNKVYLAPHDDRSMPDFEILLEAWHLRDLDARLLIDRVEKDMAHFYRLYLDPEQRAEAKRMWQKRECAPRAFAIWEAYHRRDVVARGGELIEVPVDFFSERELSALQRTIIETLNERSIAVESMPSSNLVISYYHGYREHHLFRWLGIAPDGNDLPEPIVVPASDDPGIFANNLRNDLSHLFLVMVRDLGMSPSQAVAHLRKLNRNGRIFRFGRQRSREPATPVGLSALLHPEE